MSEDLNVRAAVQYDEWLGEAAADDVDGVDLETLLGIDRGEWRILVLDIFVDGGNQEVIAYGVPANTTWQDLEALVSEGHPIVVHRLGSVDFDPQHGDTNPPPPLSVPVISAGELVGHGFKRLHIRFRRHEQIPVGASLRVAD